MFQVFCTYEGVSFCSCFCFYLCCSCFSLMFFDASFLRTGERQCPSNSMSKIVQIKWCTSHPYCAKIMGFLSVLIFWWNLMPVAFLLREGWDLELVFGIGNCVLGMHSPWSKWGRLLWILSRPFSDFFSLSNLFLSMNSFLFLNIKYIYI